jgi:hypothetical protein
MITIYVHAFKEFITYLYLSIIVLIYKSGVLALKFTLLFDAFITSFGVFYRPYFLLILSLLLECME